MDKIINFIDKAEHGIVSLIRYKYFDTPDGEDLVKKIFYTTKFSTQIGLTYALYNTIAVAFVPTFQHGFVRVCRLTWPFTLAGMLYSSTTYLAFKIRRKDDPINHFYGGLSTGIAIYYRLRKPSYGWGYGMFIAFWAAVYKGLVENGFRNKSFSNALIHRAEHPRMGPWGDVIDWRIDLTPVRPAATYSGPGQKPPPPLLYTQTPLEMKGLYNKS